MLVHIRHRPVLHIPPLTSCLALYFQLFYKSTPPPPKKIEINKCVSCSIAWALKQLNALCPFICPRGHGWGNWSLCRSPGRPLLLRGRGGVLVCEVRGQSVALSPHLPENNRVCLIFFFSSLCVWVHLSFSLHRRVEINCLEAH